MPELPEVQTVVLTLRPRILGRRVERVDLCRSDILSPSGFDLAAQLTGRSIRDIDRRGKRIVITLDDGNRFYIHLGMTGRLTIESPTSEILKHTHLTLNFHEVELRFVDPRRFGGIWWLGSNNHEKDDMGPEPLTLRPAVLANRL